MRRTTVSGLLTLLLGLSAIPVFAQGRLTLYCSSDAAGLAIAEPQVVADLSLR